MTPSSDLFDLIQALTPSEKRYFKIFATRHVQQGKNNYMRIFDLIEAQSRYDEAEVIGRIEDEKLVNQFAVQKNYLHKLILRSLRNFHAEQSIDFELKELLMNVEILLRKGLVKQSQKQLQKVEKLALEHERYEIMAELTGYKMLLIMKNEDPDLDRLESKLEGTFEQAAQNFEKLFNIQAYRKISMQLLMRNRRDPQAKTLESQAAYETLLADPLMQSEEKALTKRAALYFRQSGFVYHFSRSEFDQAFEASNGIVNLMEANPHLVAERPENYVIALQNCLMMSTFTRPLSESLERIEQLHGYSKRFPNIRFDEATEQKVPVFSANIKLRLLYNHKQFREAAEFLPEALAKLEAGYPYNVNDGYVLVDLYFMAASIFLHRKDYRQAVHFVNKLINMDGLNADYEYFLDARILNAVILLEAQEHQLLEYALTSLQRYLVQKKKLFRFERLLLDFLRKAADASSEKQRRHHYESLRDDLRKLNADPNENQTITQFDILGWLDARLEESKH